MTFAPSSWSRCGARSAWCSRTSFLFNGTIADNISYAKPEASRAELIAAARAANAHEFIVGKPDGYDHAGGREWR